MIRPLDGGGGGVTTGPLREAEHKNAATEIQYAHNGVRLFELPAAAEMIGWDGHVERMDKHNQFIQNTVGKSHGKRTFWRSRCIWDSIKMNLREICC
jgi:hypothetical protein